MADSTVEHIYSHAKFGDSDYDKKEDCEWVIEASEGRRIRLKFLSFELEHEQDCSYDYVEVYDGYDDGQSQLGKFCGNQVMVPSFSQCLYLPLSSNLLNF